MKTITISQDYFDHYFQVCFDKLKLDMLEEDSYTNTYSLHKKFHYEIAILKDKLEKY